MSVHWVNYDLKKTGQNYDELIKYLKSHDSWAKPLASSFFVSTSLSASQLRDGITKVVDANDAIVVVTVDGSDWATKGISAEVTGWMQKNI